MTRVLKQEMGGVLRTLPTSNICKTDKSIAPQSYNYIPVDYIKCRVIGLNTKYFIDVNNKNEYVHNRSYQFTEVTEADVLKRYQLEIDGLKLRIYPSNTITLSGSLHYFYNKGEHNYNDFTENAFKAALNKLYSTFGVLPKQLHLTCLEYGVNIIPPISTNLILDNLLQHKGIDFTTSINGAEGKYYQAKHDKEILKCYNKALQFKLDTELLRVEVKQKNWSKYRKLGICTIEDFIQYPKDIFVTDLLKKWNEIIFYNPTSKNEDWNKYSNINFWRSLKSKSRNTRKTHRDRLTKLNSLCRIDVQGVVAKTITEKVKSLQGVTNSDFSKNRTCALTGMDISTQRNDSHLLSHTGLKKLQEEQPTIFKEVKELFLPSTWYTSTLKDQIKEIAHQIRCRYHYRQCKLKRGQMQLF